jgi:hypothetical protein
MLLDRRGALAQLFPFREAVGALVALGADEPQRLVMPMGMTVVGDKVGGGDGVVHGV